MELIIIRTTSFDKSFNQLHKSGKEGTLAVEWAEKIIKSLPQVSWYSPEIVYRRTKKGELRIKSCEKYDLGGGYRLICARKGAELYLLFIGTHDDCDRWLERNKGLQPETDIGENSISIIEKTSPLSETSPELEDLEPGVEIDEYEEALLEKIDENTLAYVFRGLYKK